MHLTEEQGKTLKVIGIVAIVFSMLFLFVLIIYFQDYDPFYPYNVRKPNIYVYSNVEIEDTIRIDIIGGNVVKSDPFAHKSDYVEWKIKINASGVYYDNTQVPWLFYETVMESKAEVTNYGWYLEKSAETFKLNNLTYTSSSFSSIFMNELIRIGLFEKEAQDFIEYWFSPENCLFPEDGKYLLRLADNNWVDSHLVLTTYYRYEVLRVFLVLDQVIEPLAPLGIPSAEQNLNSGLVLHEWGVILHQD